MQIKSFTPGCENHLYDERELTMSSIQEEMKVAGKNKTKAGQIAARHFGSELVNFGMTEKDIIRTAGFLIDYVRERIENPDKGSRNV